MISIAVGEVSIVSNGLVFPEIASRLPRKAKKELHNWTIDRSIAKDWVAKAQSSAKELESIVRQAVANSLGMLHDVQTSVSAILRAAEDFVRDQPGTDYEEQLEGLPTSGRNLVKAVQVLQSRMTLMPLLINADAASFGQKHPTPVYKVVDRLVRIFRSVAERDRVQLLLRGTSFNKPMAFDSFETVPFILLDNAIKYSLRGQPVEVTVNDDGTGVLVAVRSFSPRILAEERPRLFSRGMRGKFAERAASKGSGLGLFLAQTVARAHGFDIRHEEEPSATVVDGVAYCTNTFAFRLR